MKYIKQFENISEDDIDANKFYILKFKDPDFKYEWWNTTTGSYYICKISTKTFHLKFGRSIYLDMTVYIFDEINNNYLTTQLKGINEKSVEFLSTFDTLIDAKTEYEIMLNVAKYNL